MTVMPDVDDPSQDDELPEDEPSEDELPEEVLSEIRKAAKAAAADREHGTSEEIVKRVTPAVERFWASPLRRSYVLPEGLFPDLTRNLFKDNPALESMQRKLSEQILGTLSLPRLDAMMRFNIGAAALASSKPELYPEPELDEEADTPPPAARKRNSPRAFFGKHAATVHTVTDFLEVVSAIQGNYSGRRLVWRGQQSADWPVQSSLHRHLLEVEDVVASEENLIEHERKAFDNAVRWGISTTPAMTFLAQLQHHGAPTRLLDISRDPNVAAWFAVEQHQEPTVDRGPARVIVWALDTSDPDLPTDAPDLFWHKWDSDSFRRQVDWGTGTSMWPWFPPAAGNERMRAQRAGFLIGASSIVTSPVAELYSEYFGQSWNTTEIARATSFLGVPVPYDRRPEDNETIPRDLRSYVPFVTIHIPGKLKPKLRAHLQETAGLDAAMIYPDFAGLTRELRSVPQLG